MFNKKSYSPEFQSWLKTDGYTKTNDRLREPTVLACARLISSALAGIPLFMQKNGKYYKPTMFDVATSPNPHQSMPELLAQIGFLLAVHNQCFLTYELTAGRVTRIDCCESPTQISVVKTRTGVIYQGVDNFMNQVKGNVIHLKLASSGITSGFDFISAGKSSIELSINAIANASEFYSKGPRAGGFISFEKQLNQEQLTTVRKRVNENTDGVNSLMVLDGGAKFSPNTSSLSDSQFIESRGSSIREIASLMGVPLPLLGIQDATYKSFEEIQRAFFSFSIGPILRLIESKLNNVMASGYSVRFDTTGFLRADPKTMAEVAGSLLSKGIISINSARDMVGEDQIAGLDDVFAVETNNLSFGNITELVNKPKEQVSQIEGEQNEQPA